MRLVEHVEQQFSMGGTVRIGLILPETINSRLLFDRLWLTVFQFEKAASRFIQNSELTQLNNKSGLKQPISPHFKAALEAAQYSAVISDGLFNPFTLPAVQRTGYLASTTSTDQIIVTDVRDRHIVGSESLEIGDDWVRIPYGTAIDLSGCGKGHIIDAMAVIARTEGAQGGWVEASGDVVAWGKDAEDNAIHVAVQSPSHTGQTYQVRIPKQGIGVATSGTFARPGMHRIDGTHHIIDPRTEKPAVTDLCLATVCAPRGLDADVLASCAIILGSHAGPAFLASHGATDWILHHTDHRKPIVHGRHVITLKQEPQYA